MTGSIQVALDNTESLAYIGVDLHMLVDVGNLCLEAFLEPFTSRMIELESKKFA